MTARLDGRVALVTGGARGMGRAEVELFAAEGALVVFGDVRKADGVALGDELGDAVRFVELDVTDEGAWDRVVREIADELGRLDVLLNNAGIATLGPLLSTTTDEFMRVVAVNQLGVFLGMRTVASLMSSGGGGSIINVSSINGLSGAPMALAYTGSKFAVRGMTKVAALEFASAGIRVNSIHPGIVDTPLLMDAAPGVDIAAGYASSIPMGRIGTVDDIARLALFLASDESGYCTGAEFVADGGVMAGTMLKLEQPVST